MDPADSDLLSRVRSYSGAGQTTVFCRVRGFHPLWPIIPDCSARVLAVRVSGPTNPPRRVPEGLALPPSLPPTCGRVGSFFFLVYRCVSVSPVLPQHLLMTLKGS